MTKKYSFHGNVFGFEERINFSLSFSLSFSFFSFSSVSIRMRVDTSGQVCYSPASVVIHSSLPPFQFFLLTLLFLSSSPSFISFLSFSFIFPFFFHSYLSPTQYLMKTTHTSVRTFASKAKNTARKFIPYSCILIPLDTE